MSTDLIFFAVNNSATAADADDLKPFGISLLPNTMEPVTVYRDPVSGRLLAQIGRVQVFRNGKVNVRPHHDCPPIGVDVLMSTALECVERELHQRDDWNYRRGTSKRVGYWSAGILMALPEGASLFAAHVTALAAQPTKALELGSETAEDLPAEAVNR